MVVNSGYGNSDKYPNEWDPRVADLVDFVEHERGLEFEHPVYVDFLSASAYSDEMRVDSSDMTDEETEALEQQTSFLRALGLASGDIDLLEAGNDLADTGTLAFYDVMSEHVVVRGKEMSVGLEVTLVHELTHALQDQVFDLEELQMGLDVDPEDPNLDVFAGYQALVEGDAVRIENAYVEGLSNDDFDEYVESYNSDVEAAEAGMGDIPGALMASQLLPYVLGQPLVDLIAADGGNDAVDDAFDQLPSTGEHLLDPRAYFDGQEAEPLDAPALPEGVTESLDEGTISAVDLYILLAERLDPLVALKAADGWGNGRYVTYEDDDRTCVRFTVDGDTEADDREIDEALQGWVDAAPIASDAEMQPDVDDTAVQSCDPGAGGPAIEDRAMDALTVPATRSQIMLDAVGAGGLDVDEAWDASNCIVGELGYEKVVALANAAEESDLPEGLDEAFSTCGAG